MRIHVISDIGNSREIQEDNYLIAKGRYLHSAIRDEIFSKQRSIADTTECDSENFFCCISDGMGGHNFGEVASHFVVSYFSKRYESLTGIFKTDITELIRQMNNEFCSAAREEKMLSDMGATLCGVMAHDGRISCFNVGDSRAYTIKNGQITQVTKDNSEGQRLLDLGVLTEDELPSFPRRKAIYKYIGKKSELIADTYEITDMHKGDYILLCSDGLTDVMSDDEILEIMSKDKLPAETRLKFAVSIAEDRKPGYGDNITAIIIEF